MSPAGSPSPPTKSRVDLLRLSVGLASTAVLVIATSTQAAGAVTAGSPFSTVPGIVQASLLESPTFGPVVAEGTLTDTSGNKAAGLGAALALPGEEINKTQRIGSRIVTPTVGWAASSSDGSFSLRIDPHLVRHGYESAAGIVNLQLVAWNGSSETDWFMPVSLASATTGGAAAAGSDSIRLVLNRKMDSGARPVGDASVPCTYTLLSTDNVWDNAGESLPWLGTGNPGTTSQFSIGYSHGETTGSAASSTGAFGSWSANGTTSTTADVTFTWAPQNTDRFYEVQSQYGKYKTPCSPTIYTWARQPTGGAQYVAAPMSNWCGGPYVTYEGPGLTFTRSSSSGDHFALSGGGEGFDGAWHRPFVWTAITAQIGG